MKEFICKAEKMTDEELQQFTDNLSHSELKIKFVQLLHHHINETKKIYDMLEDVNEDKKIFRHLYLCKIENN